MRVIIKGELKMQVNNVKQQTNFKAAYLKSNNQWTWLTGEGRVPVETIRGIFDRATRKLCVMIKAESVAPHYSIPRADFKEGLPVLFVGEEAIAFSKTKSNDVRATFLRDVFGMQFSGDLTVTQVEDAQFMAYMA